VNPYAIAALIVSMLVNLLTFSFFLGFYFGTFKEFKKNTEEKLDRLMSVFFTESQSPRRPAPAISRKAHARTAGDVDYET
jgi:hypothetical protein